MIKAINDKRKYLLLFLVLLFFSNNFLDPDFGFQLQTGRTILQTGLPKTDPFSYTMPSYPVVSHEWLLIAGVAKIFPLVGYLGLAIAFSLIFTITIYILLEKIVVIKDKAFTSIVWLATVGGIISYFGIRMQVFSWALFSLLTYIIFNLDKHKKLLYIIPFIVLVWANIHGSFPTALIVLILFFVSKWFRQKKVNYKELLILITSIVASFVNPYITEHWREVWDTASDNDLKWRVSEWKMFLFGGNLAAILLLTLSFSLIFVNRKKIQLEYLAVYLALTALMMSAIRHSPLFIIFSAPLTLKLFEQSIDKFKLDKEGKSRLKMSLKVLLFITLFIFIFQIAMHLKLSFSLRENSFYPKQAVEWLKKNPPQNNLYSDYNWGGYLIWKYPEKKVFVDGRMPSWEYKQEKIGEEKNAYDAQINIYLKKRGYKDIFEKYSVTTVLLPVDQNYGFAEILQEDNWELIYEDSISIIFAKN